MTKQARRKEKPFWETGRGRFWIGSYLVMVVLAFMVPLDVLDRYPQAKEFTDFMASWNIQVTRRPAIVPPAHRQADQFVFAVLWCVMPVYWLIWAVQTVQPYKGRWVFKQESWLNYFIVLVGSGLALWAALGMPYLSIKPRTGPVALGQILGSVMAPLWVFGTGLILMAIAYIAIAGLTGRVVITGGRNSR